MKVISIQSIEEKAFKDMDKTWFTDDQGTMGYTFSKIEIGGEYDGGWRTDARGGNQFKKENKPFNQQSFSASKTKEFKADPLKQESIEWQSCLKAAVDTVNNYHLTFARVDTLTLEEYKRDIVEAVVTFTQTIDKKPTAIEKSVEDDLPPVDLYESEAAE